MLIVSLGILCVLPTKNVIGEIGLDSISIYNPVPQHEPREDGFTEREIALFKTRYKYGYDVMGDD